MKQIGTATMMYVQDYDEKFYPLHDTLQSWAKMLEPYMKNKGITRCPSDPYATEASGLLSYIPNQAIGQFPFGAAKDGIPLAAIKSPSQFIIMMEDDESFGRGWNNWNFSNYGWHFAFSRRITDIPVGTTGSSATDMSNGTRTSGVQADIAPTLTMRPAIRTI